MFDIGFSELLLLGIVALVILGPEKLPIAMRTLGRYYAKFKHTIANLQHSIDQEFKVAELKAQMQKELEQIKKTEELMRVELDKMHTEMLKMKRDDIAKKSVTRNGEDLKSSPASNHEMLQPDSNTAHVTETHDTSKDGLS